MLSVTPSVRRDRSVDPGRPRRHAAARPRRRRSEVQEPPVEVAVLPADLAAEGVDLYSPNAKGNFESPRRCRRRCSVRHRSLAVAPRARECSGGSRSCRH